MPDFVRDDATIHYESIGSGSPLLLIPGIGSDGASWAPTIELLSDRYRVTTIHNRGAGQTRHEGPITIPDMIEDCRVLLDHLGLDKADIVGHSLGALVALRVAATNPVRVHRLVTVAATPFLTAKQMMLFDEQVQLKFEQNPERWFTQFFQWMRSDAFFVDPAKVAAAAKAAADYPFNRSPTDFAQQVSALKTLGAINPAAIGIPMLVIAAELDVLFPAASIAAAYRSIPNTRVEIISGAAHSVAVEAPQKVAEVIRSFLT
jgi:pimeloyl-ACP methyl ester carboxylesterase